MKDVLGNTTEDTLKELVDSLITSIKKKKELQALDSDFVRQEVLVYIKKNASLVPLKVNEKSAAYKQIVKAVRAKLRKSYGLFREKKTELPRLMMELSKQPIKKEILNEILQTNASTRERLSFYPQLYMDLFEITGKPQVIMDLGCGINPFSVFFMDLKEKLRYYAYDLSEEEMNYLNSFFSIFHEEYPSFQGMAKVLNLFEVGPQNQLPKSDVCFLFKVTDLLDRNKGHKKSEEVIKAIPTKYVVVSFSTLTMSGKKMTAPRRRWMEWMCQRLGYEYTVLECENEIFYVVRK